LGILPLSSNDACVVSGKLNYLTTKALFITLYFPLPDMKKFNIQSKHLHQLSILFAGLALLFGVFVYIFFRTSEFRFFHWAGTVGLEQWLRKARAGSLSWSLHTPEWFIYSLPNGLWSFAYAVLITGIWLKSHSWLKYLWMASIPVLVTGYELLQHSGVVPGTFCIADLAFGLAGLILGMLIVIKLTQLFEYETKTI